VIPARPNMKKVKFKKKEMKVRRRPDVFNKQTRTKVVQNVAGNTLKFI
jgi:hypothetical protein